MNESALVLEIVDRSLLNARSLGYASSKRFQSEINQHCFSRCQQRAAYICNQAGPHEDDNAISGVAIHQPEGRVAFIQSSGILNVYSLQSLVHDAEQLRSRSQADAYDLDEPCDARNDASSSTLEPLSTKNNTVEDNIDITGDNKENAEPGSFCKQNAFASAASLLTPATRSTGTRMSVWQRYTTSVADSHRNVLRNRARACAVVEALPPCGFRLDLRQRLEDVQWCCRQDNALGVVGGEAGKVAMLQLAQGKRSKWVLVPQHNSELASTRLTSIVCHPDGPYTVSATGRHSKGIMLWDTRRSNIATSQIMAPGPKRNTGLGSMSFIPGSAAASMSGGASLAGCLQASLDGHLLYAATQDSQLLIWDLRKGSNSSGVMHFGGTGLYHHPLLAALDLKPRLEAALTSVFSPLADLELKISPEGGHAARATPAPVDQILLDPLNTNRIALVLQDCTSAVLELPSGRISHFAPSPAAFLGPAWQEHNMGPRFARRTKKGAWCAQARHVLTPTLCHVDNMSGALGLHHAGTDLPNMQGILQHEIVCMPAVGMVDMHTGYHAQPSWTTSDQIYDELSLSSEHEARSGAAMSSHVRHARSGKDQDLVSSAERRWGENVQDRKAGLTSMLIHRHRPRHVLPVTDWVSCIASQSDGHQHVLAGTQNGQLLVLGTF